MTAMLNSKFTQRTI